MAKGVSIEGAGVGQTILKSSGVALPSSIAGNEGDFPLWPDGSFIQLKSYAYPQSSTTSQTYYGCPTDMLPAENGDQTLSGFSIDGQNGLKCGIWVYNRNNVTVHDIDIKDTTQKGANFVKSDMWWYTPIPDGKWVTNTKVYNMTFSSCGAKQRANLGLAGLDGAEIYNINITDMDGG